MTKAHVTTYRDALDTAFACIEAQEAEIEAAAEVLATAIERDQLIHVIGPGGHSNMAAEEVLWRAGGLAPINAMDFGLNRYCRLRIVMSGSCPWIANL